MSKEGNGNYPHYQHQPINLREQPRATKCGWLCHSAEQGESDSPLRADKTNSAKVCRHYRRAPVKNCSNFWIIFSRARINGEKLEELVMMIFQRAVFPCGGCRRWPWRWRNPRLITSYLFEPCCLPKRSSSIEQKGLWRIAAPCPIVIRVTAESSFRNKCSLATSYNLHVTALGTRACW